LLTISSPKHLKGQVCVFSLNGSMVYKNDINSNHTTIDLNGIEKGIYIIEIFDIEKYMPITKDKIITWSDFRKEDGENTFGLLSQISPDGRYVLSTVKDRSIFVPIDDLYYSQLFFPFKGIVG
ncbi:unnamed protein product, partial [marine sediment metagenome]